ncbi:MAG: NADH-quinone oxidoreductase subunit L, partial [Pirellulales bacterium]|nr:NADH-quinone oxidoreductase subunit L [Pirellulales bacterium]
MDTITRLMILIPALPLLAVLVTATLGPRFLRERSHWPTIIAFGVAFVLSVTLLMQVQAETKYLHESDENAQVGYEKVVSIWNWATVDSAYQTPEANYNFAIDVVLRADALTAIMLSMVTFVSLLVAIYASGYMHGESGYWRFYTYIALFVFSMTMLVSVSNFLLLYVFWEAVGVCSYLLIGFWYQKPEAAAAGKKAFLVNRIGDFGFALGLFLIWTTYGTLNYHDVLAADGAVESVGVLGQTRLSDTTLFVGGGIGLAICLLLLTGACGKSAQFPLHVWLPDAMEGPTPVSALIHAATMVTAGAYMVVRCAPLFFTSMAEPYVCSVLGIDLNAFHVVALVGGITALIAGIIAVTQNDLKRVLAYSTVSQLGFMFLSLGVGSFAGMIAAMFHLFTHAFFKALLFLGAGSVMHAMGGVIDIRRFGGLRKIMPITHWTFLIGCLALAGIFPLAGFWSKDAILGALHDQAHHASGFEHGLYTTLYYVASFAAFLTAFYMFRAFYLTFYGREEVPAEAHGHAHESPGSMTVSLIILAVCSLIVGWLCHAGHANGQHNGDG